jgi:lysine 2,3-aminomutase
VQELHQRASGIAQAQYVLDIPGGHGKSPLATPSIRETDEGYEVRDKNGAWRPYPRDGA